MTSKLQSECERGVLDWEKPALALAIIVIILVTLLASLSLIDRDAIPANPASVERKYPNPELKAL